ncbi:MAG: UDP-2,3-diacylglucosamine diphosphatase [Luteibaculum sp.]
MISTRNHIYFASDFHLGVPDEKSSLEREKRVVAWLESIKDKAREIYLMGDLFDFWFDYKTVVPKGFIRLLGKIAELSDAGIQIHLFPGNHDMWMFGYFEKELNVTFHQDFYSFTAGNKNFLLHHGDGLGPGDHGYKFIKKVFANKGLQFLFKWLHPDVGIGIANFWSKQSSKKTRSKDAIYHGKEKEWLVSFCEEHLKKHPETDYYIFGHRHLPLDITLANKRSRYINLGDWISHFTFAEFDGNDLRLMHFNASGQHEIARGLASG